MEKKFFKNFSIILFLICSCLIISSSFAMDNIAMDTSRSYDSSASSIDSPEDAASVANSPDHSGPHSPSGTPETSRSSSPGSKAANASGLDERAVLVKTLKESIETIDLGEHKEVILNGLEKPENLLVLALLQSRFMNPQVPEKQKKQVSELIEKIRSISKDENLQARRRLSGEFKLDKGIERPAGEFFAQQRPASRRKSLLGSKDQ